MREHPEVRILFERRHLLPRPVKIGGVNPILHVIIEGIVENQLNDPRSPEVREAVERLQQQGLTRHAARANVARLFSEFFHEALSRKQAFDEDGYRSQVRLVGTDLLARLGRVEEAEQEYRVLFSTLPNWHFGRYRYALYLGERGKKEEALAVLRELVARWDAVDEETYVAVSEVLEDLERD